MTRNVTCKTTPVSRAKGHTAIGGAAYRAGENLKAIGVGENGEDKWYRYSPKAVVVRETFILRPDGAPEFTDDRAALWNHVEAMETRANARLGRDVNLGLAYELDHDEQRDLIVEFATREFVEKGFVVDVSIHNYGRTIPSVGAPDDQAQRLRDWAAADIPFLEKDEAQGVSDVHVMIMRNRQGDATGYKLYQPHAHLRVTPRPCVDGEFAKDKYASREMNRHEKAMEWRYEWPKLQNAYLEQAGSEVRVTCTSDTEDQFPDLRFLGKNDKSQTRTIEQKRDHLSEEQREIHDAKSEAKEADEMFRQMHNESIRDTYLEMEASALEPADEGAERRVALWWHNMSRCFGQWRTDLRDVAEEWRTRFEQQKQRIARAIGWRDMERPDDGFAPSPDNGADRSQDGQEIDR